MSMACLFTAPIRLNLTNNTPIPDRPARFLFFALIAKNILMKFCGHGDIHFKLLYPTQTTLDRYQDHFMFTFVVNLALFFVFDGVWTIKKTHTERKLQRSRPDQFSGCWTVPASKLSKIRPHDLNFLWSCAVQSGDPWRSVCPTHL